MAIAVAGLFLPATEAFALWDDKLKLFAEEKITHDDNVFRFSRDLDPVGDTYHTTSLGFNLDVPVSRQRFQVDYAWNATRFNRSTDLDFNGHDARAAWLWQLGNDASGQLGYAETFALASFANTQSRVPDPLKTRQAFFNAAYLVTPRWRLQAGVSGLELSNGAPVVNGAPVFQNLDLDVLYTEVAVSYVTPANNSVGLSARTEDGRYPKSPSDNAYGQYRAGVVADWAPTGVSHVSARADHVSRHYAQVPQQNFDGNTARAEYDWKPTGKFLLAGVVQRDIFPYQDIGSSFVLVKGVLLRPTLGLTEKIDVSGTLDYSIREFLGNPGLPSGVPSNRTDRVRSVTATISYRPARTFTLQLSAQREVRSSNVVSAAAVDATATSRAIPAVVPVDYVANVFSISARITF
jgi:exopolysaccharide biosynthesis operon protein EpsL